MAAPERHLNTAKSRRYWTLQAIALWFIHQLADAVPMTVGIDHGFSVLVRYFAHGLPFDWDAFLDDFVARAGRQPIIILLISILWEKGLSVRVLHVKGKLGGVVSIDGQLSSSILDDWANRAPAVAINVSAEPPENFPRSVSEPLFDGLLTIADRFTASQQPVSNLERNSILLTD